VWKRAEKRADGLVDDLMETYVAWREECSRVETAYRRWGVARPAERMLADQR
jgi:hypothetical protein